jgi:excisionase family DNA binding protein
MDDNKQPQLKPFAVSVTEAARITASGESTIWEKLAKGELDAVKDGGRTKVTMASIERHVASWPKAKFQPLKPRRRAARAARTTPSSKTGSASATPGA